jgi:hypothetical protein
MRRGTWRERRSGRYSFSQWADDWWEVWAADPDRSPTTLAATENRLRRHVRPWFGDRPIERIGPADIRRWQAQLAAMVGRESRRPTCWRPSGWSRPGMPCWPQPLRAG